MSNVITNINYVYFFNSYTCMYSLKACGHFSLLSLRNTASV